MAKGPGKSPANQTMKNLKYDKKATAQAKQNLRVPCPKGKLEFKFFFSSPDGHYELTYMALPGTDMQHRIT